jgi:hypothetical protein
LVTDWSTRVNTNGGAVPTTAIIKAVNDAYNRLANVGILSNILVFNPFAYGGGGAGSLVTILTPLIKGPSGKDPWTTSNFINGSTTINGLVGGNIDELHIGFNPSTGFVSINSAGQSIYAFTAGNDGVNYDCGCFNGADGVFTIHVNDAGNTLYDCFSLANRVTVATSGAGFYGVNRVSASDLRLFFGNGTTASQQVGTTSALGAGAMPNTEQFVMGLNNNGVGTLPTVHTISCYVAHTGLTLQQWDLLKQTVQAMRVAMGGGSV